jgi:hypothetical protein
MKFSNTLIHWYLQTREICLGVVPPIPCNLAPKSCFNKLVAQVLRLILAQLHFHCFDLAEAEEEVLKLWQGLGYYSC